MKLKIWIIASCICIAPLVILGICMPLVCVINHNAHPSPARIIILLSVTTICVMVILATFLIVSRHTAHIDKMEQKMKDLDAEYIRVERVRYNYEKLIANNEVETESDSIPVQCARCGEYFAYGDAQYHKSVCTKGGKT